MTANIPDPVQYMLIFVDAAVAFAKSHAVFHAEPASMGTVAE